MADYFLFIVLVQALFLQIAYTQCINRITPNGQPMEFQPIDILPTQLVQAGLPPYSSYPPYIAAVDCAPDSVANSLANALQLLIVSNLLSTTLPGVCDPGYDPYTSMAPVGPYSYIYQ